MIHSLEKLYRPDIDGLRAVAVLTILFYHAGFNWAQGGFIGVDVFFVISGYLITRNITLNIQKENFSFKTFYISRIRRLYPALLFTLLITLLLGYLLFSPNDLQRLGHSLSYALLSVSNFFFWGEAGYFNTSSEIKPLLHTWSLSIEEQFYLIWPSVLFILVLKKKRIIIAFFCFISIVSLLLSQWLITKNPEAVFFLLPFRIFEFSIGAMCVFMPRINLYNRYIKEIMTIIGMLLIFVPVLLYSHSTVFPGISALLPCLGTALIIYNKDSLFSNIVFNNALLVKIGLMSYSIYLIHWPLFVYYRYWTFSPLSLSAALCLSGLSIFFGFLMWKYIETPFRYKKNKQSSQLFLLLTAVIALVLLLLSTLVWLSKGVPSRFPDHFQMSNNEIRENRNRYWKEFRKTKKELLIGNKESKQVVIIGNSHAIDLIYMLRQNNSNINIVFLPTSHKCYNFGTAIHNKDKNYCQSKLSENLANEYIKNADSLYLHDHWPKLDRIDFENRLQSMRLLTSAPIYVFGPKMAYKKSIPLIVNAHMRIATVNEFSQKFMKKDRIKTNKIIKNTVETTTLQNIHYVDMLETQCGKSLLSCEIISSANQEFLYFDSEHFTLSGAKELGSKLKTKYPHLF
ncbi:MAG: acyltransferase family protein [Marinicellaceae bacterium]